MTNDLETTLRGLIETCSFSSNPAICFQMSALAEACAEYRAALYCECLPNKLGALCVRCEIDRELLKKLGGGEAT